PDRAQSGAIWFRPQYQQMIVDVERRQFDVLVCEALDRHGHKLADIPDLRWNRTTRRIRPAIRKREGYWSVGIR
ncbi:MAG TPA: recombinase family protein, partial [Candidatus Udaeobacter sp.]|nr:recombinase family protein [Candidatus Udaeobacter sp.]